MQIVRSGIHVFGRLDRKLRFSIVLCGSLALAAYLAFDHLSSCGEDVRSAGNAEPVRLAETATIAAVRTPVSNVLQRRRIEISSSALTADTTAHQTWLLLQTAHFRMAIPGGADWSLIGAKYGTQILDHDFVGLEGPGDTLVVINVLTGQIDVLTGNQQIEVRDNAGRTIDHSVLRELKKSLAPVIIHMMETFRPVGRSFPMQTTP